ncbi:hypothetical protein N9L68_08800 [bacterium]|nr:hypothetical protein [bacterium]
MMGLGPTPNLISIAWHGREATAEVTESARARCVYPLAATLEEDFGLGWDECMRVAEKS